MAARVRRGLGVETVLDISADDTGLTAQLHAEGIKADHAEVTDAGQAVDLPDGRWDLVTCLNLLEHLSAIQAERLIDGVCARSDMVLVSCTSGAYFTPDPSTPRWAAAFAERGFFRRLDADFTVVAPWAVVFERGTPSARDIAFRYELLLQRVATELARIERHGGGHADGSDAEVQREVAELRHHVLTSRDFAIGAEAEIARLQAECQRYKEALEAVYTSTSWLVIRRGIAPIVKRLKGITRRGR